MLSFRWLVAVVFLVCLGNSLRESVIPAHCFMQVKDSPNGLLFECWPALQPCTNCENPGTCRQHAEESQFFVFFECWCEDATGGHEGSPCDTLLSYDLETDEIEWRCFPNCCPEEEPTCSDPPKPLPPIPDWTAACPCI
jgi:hypothetical protein